MDTLKKQDKPQQDVAVGPYIYCILDRSKVPADGFGIQGLANSDLRLVPFNDICAVVSDMPLNNQRATRENMIHHTQVLEKILQFQQMLPVRFGVIAGSDEEVVSKLLQPDYDHLKETLNNLSGKLEVSVRVLWQQDEVLKKILETHKEITDLRDSLIGKPDEQIHYQKIEVGRMIESALNEERDSLRETVLSALQPMMLDQKENKLVTEAMVLNLAALIDASREQGFADTLSKLDEEYKNLLIFKYTAVAPPYNFVNITVKI